VNTDTLPRFILDLLAACPAAGTGVHGWLYKVARQLWAHRTRDEIISLLNATVAGCGRSVSISEIVAAVDNSKETAWQPTGGKGWIAPTAPTKTWTGLDAEARAAVVAAGGKLIDLWNTSPGRPELAADPAEHVIDTLFPGDPLLCCGKSSSEFDTKPREAWRGQLAGLQLIVPSPMSAVLGKRKADGEPSKHTLDNTGQRRFLVVEFDHGTADEHAAILLHLAGRAPLVLAVHSGGKSLHGWFYCAGQPEDKLRRFMSYAVSLGADPATWSKSQFVRMPAGHRDNDKLQQVFFLNPKPLEGKP
jgi:hypothetical protein